MDAKGGKKDYPWTNDRHIRFLKSLEASFVRTMLENGDGGFLLSMSRCLPDSCESTLDSKMTTSTGTKRRTRPFPAENLDPSRITNDRIVKRSRVHLSSSSQDDQIVPQMKHIKTEDNDNYAR